MQSNICFESAPCCVAHVIICRAFLHLKTMGHCCADKQLSFQTSGVRLHTLLIRLIPPHPPLPASPFLPPPASFTLARSLPSVQQCNYTASLAKVRESSPFSGSAPGSLKDIDSSDLCVTVPPPTEVH